MAAVSNGNPHWDTVYSRPASHMYDLRLRGLRDHIRQLGCMLCHFMSTMQHRSSGSFLNLSCKVGFLGIVMANLDMLVSFHNLLWHIGLQQMLSVPPLFSSHPTTIAHVAHFAVWLALPSQFYSIYMPSRLPVVGLYHLYGLPSSLPVLWLSKSLPLYCL